MRPKTKALLPAAAALLLLLHAAPSLAEEAAAPVKIKKWKADPVELYDRPDGKVVQAKPAGELPAEAERMGQGWLKVKVGGQDYFVESSQARTDLKLTGKPKCENLAGATGYAASRGYGQEDCEP
jgi:hypothetical protein